LHTGPTQAKLSAYALMVALHLLLLLLLQSLMV
jgi:hypothetical protein